MSTTEDAGAPDMELASDEDVDSGTSSCSGGPNLEGFSSERGRLMSGRLWATLLSRGAYPSEAHANIMTSATMTRLNNCFRGSGIPYE